MSPFPLTSTLPSSPGGLVPPKLFRSLTFAGYSIFLYLFLLALFAGTLYFIYSTWITTLFPQKAKSGKAKKSTHGAKKVDPTDQVSVVGADGPAVTSGAKAYDESWIPEGHLNRPGAKRVKSGARPKSKAG